MNLQKSKKAEHDEQRKPKMPGMVVERFNPKPPEVAHLQAAEAQTRMKDIVVLIRIREQIHLILQTGPTSTSARSHVFSELTMSQPFGLLSESCMSDGGMRVHIK